MLLSAVHSIRPFFALTPKASSSQSPTLETLYNAWKLDDTVFTRTQLLRHVAKRRFSMDWPFLDWFTSAQGRSHVYFEEWFFAIASSMSQLDDDHFFELKNDTLKEAYFLGVWSRSFVKPGTQWKYYCLEFGKRDYTPWKHAQWLWLVRQNHRSNIPLALYTEDIIRCLYPQMSFFYALYENLSWLDMAYRVEQHLHAKSIDAIDLYE